MATIRINRGKWQAIVRRAGFPQQSKSFDSKTNARKWARQREAELDSGVIQTDSREEAALCGLSRFYTGRSCKLGHNAPRYVSNKNCVACNSERAAEREKQRSATDPSVIPPKISGVHKQDCLGIII